jgi:hypothetical protein
MKTRRLIAVMSMSLASFFLSTACHAAAPQDSLWKKAVALAETGSGWIPGKMMFRQEKLDGKGATTRSSERWMQAVAVGDGSFTYETFKVLVDGKDMTQQEKAAEREEAAKANARSDGKAKDRAKDEAKESGDKGGESVSYSFSSPDIFEAQAQDRVSARPLGQRKVVRGRHCVSYEFMTERDQKAYREKLTGVAWLEEQTGIPVELQYTASPLPKHVKGAHTTVRYENAPDGSFYPADLITEGNGGFLFIKVNLRMTLKYLEYRKLSGK